MINKNSDGDTLAGWATIGGILSLILSLIILCHILDNMGKRFLYSKKDCNGVYFQLLENTTIALEL